MTLRPSIRVAPWFALALMGCSFEEPPIELGPLAPQPPAPDAEVDQAPPDAAPGLPDAKPGTPDGAPVVVPDAAIAAAEKLTIAFDTTIKGGNYQPKNIVAVWVETSTGAFTKTIGRWAGTRRQYLVEWAKKSGQDSDAVSGATRPNHNTRLTVNWDFKKKSGQVVPDGTYTIRMELADKNAKLATDNHQATFTVQKNGTASEQNTSQTGFQNVNIKYSGR